MFNFFKNRKRKKIQDVLIKEFGFKDNTLNCVMQHPEFAFLTEGLVKMFEDAKGTNYVSVRTYHEKMGFFEVTIQKCDGITPAEKNMELKKLIKDIKDYINTEHKINCALTDEIIEFIEQKESELT